MSSTNSSKDPVNQLAPKEPGAPLADDHDRSGPPSQEVIARGYEADVYDSRTVMSVPLLVVLFFVLAFGTVSIIFSVIAYPKSDGKGHPAASQRNKRAINDRMKDIHRGSKEVDQPRLEPLKLRAGDSRAITQPELHDGNSPELHPEDIRATADRFPELYSTTNNTIGLDKTMALSNDALKELFPVQPGGMTPANSQHVPTAANAGRGFGDSTVTPVLPRTPEPKKEEKKDDKKDNTPPDPKGGKK